MNKLFDIDSPLMQAMSRIVDLVLLSFLWFVCCLPIITIGPSTTAMYYVTLKMARKEELKITREFFSAFKSNFKQSAIMNLIFLVVGAVLLADYIIMSGAEDTMGMFSSVCFFVMFIWLLCVVFYAYPLQAQFFNTIKQTLINAAILSMRKFLYTVIIFVLNMLPVILAYMRWGSMLLVRTAPLWILLMPGVVAFINGKLFAKMFDPFLKAGKEDTENE